MDAVYSLVPPACVSLSLSLPPSLSRCATLVLARPVGYAQRLSVTPSCLSLSLLTQGASAPTWIVAPSTAQHSSLSLSLSLSRTHARPLILALPQSLSLNRSRSLLDIVLVCSVEDLRLSPPTPAPVPARRWCSLSLSLSESPVRARATDLFNLTLRSLHPTEAVRSTVPLGPDGALGTGDCSQLAPAVQPEGEGQS